MWVVGVGGVWVVWGWGVGGRGPGGRGKRARRERKKLGETAGNRRKPEETAGDRRKPQETEGDETVGNKIRRAVSARADSTARSCATDFWMSPDGFLDVTAPTTATYHPPPAALARTGSSLLAWAVLLRKRAMCSGAPWKGDGGSRGRGSAKGRGGEQLRVCSGVVLHFYTYRCTPIESTFYMWMYV